MEFHPHEILVLKNLKKKSAPHEVAEKSGLSVDAVLRASSWLKTKGLVGVEEKVSEEVSLGDEGRIYLKEGLPERQILNVVGEGESIGVLKKKVPPNVFGIGVGWLKKKKLAEIKEERIRVISARKTDDELLLDRVGGGPVNSSKLSKKESEALELLKQRKNVVETKEVKEITLTPTKEGLGLSSKIKENDSISQLTPEMLSSGDWKGKKFRPYDVSVYVKPIYPAKRHPLQSEIERIRAIFMGMGFSEIKGGFVESAFWNFDALFTAQDHPAREMHDTFYLKNPSRISIPDFERLWKNISETHENGWTTGSTGWKYKWDKETSKKTLLRTHTTAVTGRHLSTLTEKNLPAKVFSIGKVFRNETLDYKHLPEFYQVEGIVADKNATFKHLLGILKEFYDQMGFKKIRFRPAYFPYTEMSVEPEVYFKEKEEWIELGGAGIFRPEVVKPLLGFDCPVLAWGLGVDRVVALKLGLNDIRDLYVSDLDWLRKTCIQY